MFQTGLLPVLPGPSDNERRNNVEGSHLQRVYWPYVGVKSEILLCVVFLVRPNSLTFNRNEACIYKNCKKTDWPRVGHWGSIAEICDNLPFWLPSGRIAKLTIHLYIAPRLRMPALTLPLPMGTTYNFNVGNRRPLLMSPCELHSVAAVFDRHRITPNKFIRCTLSCQLFVQ